MQTLTSLLEGLNEEEKEDALIIVFIAEVNVANYLYPIFNKD